MKKLSLVLAMLVALSLLLPACRPDDDDDRLHIVVTYSVLGSLVKELVGDSALVTVSVPNGLDPHEWEPSARDISAINRADLVVQNGLGLEGGLEKTLSAAKKRGVKFFTAADFVDIRFVGPGEGIPSGDPDQQPGAPDPHIWTDPLAIRGVVAALAAELVDSFGLDVRSQAESLISRLDVLDGTIRTELAAIPSGNRKLVTGHESLGYFARCYDFRLVGAVIPSLTSQAGVSAADLAALKGLILVNQVNVVFTELGTSTAVASAVSRETGVRLVEINTHLLSADGSYFTLMEDLARTVGEALK